MKKNTEIRKIDSIGRVYIPKKILDKLNIKYKDSLEFYIKEDTIILKKFGNN